MAQDQLLLKVFTGPHAGAEIVLIDEQYVIGSSDPADIVLTDPGLAGEHVRLQNDGGSVRFEVLGDAIAYVDGQPTPEGQLEDFAFLTIGTTHVAIGPAGEEWPQRDLPTLVEPEPVVEATDSEEEEEEETDSDAQTEKPEASEVAAAEQETQPASDAEETPRSHRGRWLAAAGLLLLLVCGGLFVVISTANANNGNLQPEPTVASVQQLEQIVLQIAPASTVTITENDGEVSASGYVITKDTLGELEQALAQANPEIDTDDIRDTESVARSARSLLKMRKLNPLEVKTTENAGEIAVSGVLEELEPWARAKVEIEKKTRVVSIVDEVSTVAAQRLAAQSESNTAAKKVGPNPNQATTEKPKKRGLPFQISNVTTGRASFFTTSDGTKVSVGSTLQGYVVKSISPDKIIFTRNGTEVVARLGK